MLSPRIASRVMNTHQANQELLRQLSVLLRDSIFNLDVLEDIIPVTVVSKAEWYELQHSHKAASVYQLLLLLYAKGRLDVFVSALQYKKYVRCLDIIRSSPAASLFGLGPAQASSPVLTDDQAYHLSQYLRAADGGSAWHSVRHKLHSALSEPKKGFFSYSLVADSDDFVARIRSNRITADYVVAALMSAGQGRIADLVFAGTSTAESVATGRTDAAAAMVTDRETVRTVRTVSDTPPPVIHEAISRTWTPAVTGKRPQGAPNRSLWIAFFAGKAKTTVGRSDSYIVNAINSSNDVIMKLSITGVLIAVLKFTAGNVLAFLDAFPFIAPFIHLCIALEGINTEFAVGQRTELSLDAFYSIAHNQSLAALMSITNEQLLALLKPALNLRIALAKKISEDDPSFVSSHDTLHKNHQLFIDFFNRDAFRRSAFLALFYQHASGITGAPNDVFFDTPAQILDEYDREKAEKIQSDNLVTTSASTADADMDDFSWLDDFIKLVSTNADNKKKIATYFKAQELSRDILHHVTAEQLRRSDFNEGLIIKIIDALARFK